MASPDQERRDAFAQEHGYDTYNEFRVNRDTLRDLMEDNGTELSAREATRLLDWDNSIDVEGIANPGEKREALLDAWHDEFGYDDDEAFYDWLHAHYEKTAG